MATSQGCAQLVMFELQESEPRKLCSHDVPGVLSLDLLFCQGATETVVVGSNAKNTLHVYSFSDNTAVKIADLNLDDDERPTGLCGALATRRITRSNHGSSDPSSHYEGILVAAAKRIPANIAFPSASVYEERQVTLKYMMLPGQSTRTYVQNPKELPNSKMFREIQLPNGNSKVHLLRIAPLRGNMSGENTEDEPPIKPEATISQSISSASSEHTHHNHSKRSVSFTSRALPDPPSEASSGPSRKLPEIPDVREIFPNHSAVDGLFTKSGHMTDTSERSESPEFNLVLPNSHSNFYAMDSERPKSKILLVDGSTASSISSSELQTERTSFQSKQASFGNSVNTYFESIDHKGGSNPDLMNAPGQSEQSNTKTRNKSPHDSSCLQTKPRGSSCDSSINSHVSDKEIGDAEYSDKDIEECLQTLSRDSAAETRGLDGRHDSLQNHSRQSNELQMRHQIQDMEHIIKSQGDEIVKLEGRISNISRRMDVNPQHVGYSTFTQPDLVTLVFRKQGEEQKKSFLLDQNRLELQTVKDAFGLKTVEMFIGESRAVVSCNSDGYIPLLFEPNTVVNIYGISAGS